MQILRLSLKVRACICASTALSMAPAQLQLHPHLIQRTHMSPAVDESHARFWGHKAEEFLVLENAVGVS